MRTTFVEVITRKKVTVLDEINDFRVNQYLEDMDFIDDDLEVKEGCGYLQVIKVGSKSIVARVLGASRGDSDFIVIKIDELIESKDYAPNWMLREVSKDEIQKYLV